VGKVGHFSVRIFNTGFASGGVTCKLGALCFYSSSVLVDPESFRDAPKPARTQIPKTLAVIVTDDIIKY